MQSSLSGHLAPPLSSRVSSAMSEAYSPRRRPPHFIRHSTRREDQTPAKDDPAAQEEWKRQQMHHQTKHSSSAAALLSSSASSSSANEIPLARDAAGMSHPHRSLGNLRNGTRDFFDQSSATTKDAMHLGLQSPTHQQGKTAANATHLSRATPYQHTQGFLSPILQQQSAHTPATAFTATPLSAHSASFGGADFASSPIQPHQLSFDGSASPCDETDDSMAGAHHHKSSSSSSPLAPFPFVTALASPNARGRRNSLPSHQLQQQHQQHLAFPPLVASANSFLSSPVDSSVSSANSSLNHSAFHSTSTSHSTPAADASLFFSPGGVLQSSGVATPEPSTPMGIGAPFIVRISSDSPRAAGHSMDLGSTPPSSTHQLGANPFVSPAPVRVVGLNGKALQPRVLPLVLASPSPLAPPNSRGLMGPPSTSSSSSSAAKPPHHHMRSLSGDLDWSTGGALRTGGSRRAPLLNAKRTRGSSMDLEAEREAGGAVTDQAILEADSCPAAAITQSMRKLKVKKTGDASPAPMPRAAARARRNSGFSSSEDEAESSPTHHQHQTYASSSSTAQTPSSCGPNQNMKMLRRAKQLQSVQKKREQQQQQQAASSGGLNFDRGEDMNEPPASAAAGLSAALAQAAANSQLHAKQPSMDLGVGSPRRKLGQLLQIAIPPAHDAMSPPTTAQMMHLHTDLAMHAGADAMCLKSPPAAHVADMVGSRLTWSSDDEEADSDSEQSTRSGQRRRPMVHGSLPSFVLPLATTTPFKPLPQLEDLEADSPPTGTRVVQALDFSAAADDDMLEQQHAGATAADQEEEGRDTMGRFMDFSRGNSLGAGAFIQQFGDQTGTPQMHGRPLTSPPPNHTPLTPAANSTSVFNFHVPMATPLPVLPGMAPPRSEMRPTNDRHNNTSSASELDTSDCPSASDFMSPTTTTTTLCFGGFGSAHGSESGPCSSPLQMTDSLGLMLPEQALLSPMGDSFPHSFDGSMLHLEHEPRSMSDARGSLSHNTSHSQNASEAESTPPSSPPVRGSAGGSFLGVPGSSLLFAMSPDPKAFAAESFGPSKQKTPARGKLQPPPTPLRPSSIRKHVQHAPQATPAKPMKLSSHLAMSSSKLLHLAIPSSSSSSSKDGSETPPPSHGPTGGSTSFAPLYLPPLRGGRLERTSSLYDSKILVDFKAHADAMKKKLREEAERDGLVIEPDAEMSEPNSPTTAASVNVSTSGAAGVGVVSSSSSVGGPTNVSIWETSFTNKHLVGSGSFFQTYRCQSCDLAGHPDEYGEFFAVKRSIKEFRGKKDRGLYLREVAVMESIGHHENIVKHVRAWQEDLHFFIQMEFCPLNLSQYISSLQAAAASACTPRGGAMSPTSNPYNLSDPLLKNITMQLASALHHIHSRDLIHLDIKPDNVLVSHSGILRLADFGQARIISPSSLADNSWDMDGVEGDSIFMAPELLDPSASGQKGPTSAADIFSLGLLLVEVASGVCLPKSGDVWHDLREGRAHQHVHDKVSTQMLHLILNMLEPKPNRRPTAKSIILWLEAHQ